MKFTFEENDIEAGLFIIRKNINGKTPKDMDFARTVLFKICYILAKSDLPKWGICEILTDGLYTPIGDTKQDVADFLNRDSKGYEPLSKEYMLKLVEHTRQGFLLK